MKLKTKAGKPTFVLTLTAKEATVLYLAITPSTARNWATEENSEKYYELACDIEGALGDALDAAEVI